jgi:hypothetical protein
VFGDDALDDGFEGELLVGVEAADGLELKAEGVVGSSLSRSKSRRSERCATPWPAS